MLSYTKSRLAGKTLLQTSFFFLLVTQICFAQWYQQNSGTTNGLYGVSFTDANNGTVVGDFGTILRTTDGGQNWIDQTSSINGVLYGVSFTDANNGTAVGFYDSLGVREAILRTTNGGQNWISQTSSINGVLHGVSFTDANNGTAVGVWQIINFVWSIITRTTDGGITWTEQRVQEGKLNCVSFTDANNGTAVGNYGTIIRTTDGGTTWASQTSGTQHHLRGVSFTDANNGTAVGGHGENNTILRTTDGGITWAEQSSGTTNWLYGVSFNDTNNGTVVGQNGTILRTTNGGTTWIQQTSGTTVTLNGVSFTDANNGWAVGDNGTILHTTNGGVPVELTSFTTTTNGKEVILNWSTATELNNQGFEVQRSIEGEEFFTVGFVNGHGTTTEQQNYSYADRNLDNGNYYYRLKQIDYLGSYEYSDVIEIDFRAFSLYLLEQNYPNPFNPTTTIGFGLQNKSNVKITILNAIGEDIAVVLNEDREAGFHQVEFNAALLPSGVYFYQLKAGNFVETKKMLLLK